MLMYLLFCNYIFDDLNFDIFNSYGYIFIIVLRYLVILFLKFFFFEVENKL